MAGRKPRHNNDGNANNNGAKPKDLPKWLYDQLNGLSGRSTDLMTKLERAVKEDTALLARLERATDTKCREMLRQLKDDVLGSRKSARDEAKDQGKAAVKSTKVNAKYTKLIGDDFTTATLWDGQALQFDDGTIAERLDDVEDLGAVLGFMFTSINMGKKLMKQRFGK